jgi:hypothetical protein
MKVDLRQGPMESLVADYRDGLQSQFVKSLSGGTNAAKKTRATCTV